MQQALNNANNVKTQLDSCLILSKKQAEEIEALKKKTKGLKRARIASLCITATGLIVGGIGVLLKQDEATRNIGNSLVICGATAIGAGVTTFAISITIPF